MFTRLYQTKNRRKQPSIDGIEVQPEMKMTKAELLVIKTNQKLIVNLLEKIVLLSNDLLNEELRGQLIDAYVVIQQQLRLESKPLKFLLGKYGYNIQEMISQRVGVATVSLTPERPIDRSSAQDQANDSHLLASPRVVSEQYQAPIKQESSSLSPLPPPKLFQNVRQSYDPQIRDRLPLHQPYSG